MPRPKTIAIIGSFKQHLAQVSRAREVFRDAAMEITSPQGDEIIEPGIDFVRFRSDPPHADDPMVQTIALHRILRSDLVYVVSPERYIGRTTCYEVGRIIQCGRPIFFENQPADLPVAVPDSCIVSAEALARQITDGTVKLTRIFEARSDEYSMAEEDLLHGRFKND